jgi:hypothetical protein
MSLPAIYRPPFLVERALILCSGRPPSYERGIEGIGLLRYATISMEVASLAASILRQELCHEQPSPNI